MSLASTLSIIGIESFDSLCNDPPVRAYSYKLINLCEDDKTELNFTFALDKLVKQVKDTFLAIEDGTDRHIKAYTIGKSYVRKKSGTTFNPLNTNTWNLAGVSQRWQKYRDKKKYDGLVVLAGVTRKLLPAKLKEFKMMDQQMFALALEQALIQHFIFKEIDHRIDNTSLHIGRTSKGAICFVVYVAYQLENEYRTPVCSVDVSEDEESGGTLEYSDD